MISLVTTIIKTVFPDRTRATIVLLTTLLCLSAVWAIEHFEIGKKLPATLLPLLLKSLSVALLLALGLVALLITSSPKHKASLTKEAKSRKDLSANALLILTIFGKQGVERLTTEQFSKALDLSFNNAQYAIDELLRFNFLHVDTPWGEDSVYWLSSKGRALLGKEKLL